MKVKLFIFSVIVFVTSCSPSQEKTIEQNTTITKQDSLPLDYSGCYTMIVGRDTAYLSLKGNESKLTGSLDYDRFEKDSNKGTVSLSISGDTAAGWYNFQSEGMETVREIVFRVSAGSLAEAYGEISATGDSVKYKYRHALSFEEKHPFVKSACK